MQDGGVVGSGAELTGHTTQHEGVFCDRSARNNDTTINNSAIRGKKNKHQDQEITSFLWGGAREIMLVTRAESLARAPFAFVIIITTKWLQPQVRAGRAGIGAVGDRACLSPSISFLGLASLARHRSAQGP